MQQVKLGLVITTIIEIDFTLRILTKKKRPQIKLQCLQKI